MHDDMPSDDAVYHKLNSIEETKSSKGYMNSIYVHVIIPQNLAIYQEVNLLTSLSYWSLINYYHLQRMPFDVHFHQIYNFIKMLLAEKG